MVPLLQIIEFQPLLFLVSAHFVAEVAMWGLAVGFLMGGTGACPLVGGALSLGEIRGGSVPGVSLGSLSTNGWGCDPTWIIVWPEGSQQ